MTTETRLCPCCTEIKYLSDFHKDATRKDGVTSHCKECRKPAGKKKRNGYKNMNNRQMEASKRYIAKYPKKRLAIAFIRRLITKGVILPASSKKCIHCRKQAQHYHHWNGCEPINYLEIVPLCMPCHKAEHKRMKLETN